MRAQLSLCVVAAASLFACGEGEPEYSLETGVYGFTFEEATQDTCWPTWETWPPRITTEIGLDENDALWLIHPPTAIDWLLPSMQGSIVDGRLLTDGYATTELSETCSLRATGHLDVSAVASHVFAGSLQVTFEAVPTAESVDADCQNLVGTRMKVVVPFPDLSNPTNGSCDITVNVRGNLRAQHD